MFALLDGLVAMDSASSFVFLRMSYCSLSVTSSRMHGVVRSEYCNLNGGANILAMSTECWPWSPDGIPCVLRLLARLGEM